MHAGIDDGVVILHFTRGHDIVEFARGTHHTVARAFSLRGHAPRVAQRDILLTGNVVSRQSGNYIEVTCENDGQTGILLDYLLHLRLADGHLFLAASITGVVKMGIEEQETGCRALVAGRTQVQRRLNWLP